GHTLFVEPLALVAEGNELQELRDAEAEEVARILRRLSGLVAARVSELAAALRAAGELDLLFAKRRFSSRFNGQRPAPAPDDRLELVQARHPLLEHRGVKVVPLDMRCPDGTRVVLISGPNAGGKTVALKTAGLLALMFKAGMYVPAAKGTCMPVFGQVFADIGDEQSLETDLSSFTAHVKRLTEILDKSDAQSLVLIDEIGSSTSPEEGAALAVAVLEELRDRGVRSIVTTHFGALKLFVQDEPGMVNAAMEWGPQDTEVGPMRNGPTYRLRMGLPGESSALEIAAEAGLPSGVIERARARIGRAWLDLGAKLKTLDEELRRARKARSAAEEEQRQSSQTHAALRARLSEAEAAARASAVRLRDVEERLLREKRREIENLVRKIKEQKADHESIVAAKQHVEAALKELEPRPEEESRSSSEVAGLGPGDEVESHTFRRRGSVVEVKGDHATVAFGHIRVALSVADLKLVAPAGVQSEAVVVAEEPFHFDTRLEVIGLTREEAGEAVDRFLDEARMVGSSELTIVHGKGGGVLRRALWERLRGDKRVETITLAEPAAGGSGVTLVRLVQEKAEVENRSPLPPRRREELD
ncbi:hypothetical protein FJY70_04125, partial [candidate division WOR-3 bacterium]|nr:hypothetical protein [candidate division WOR-3 bacterium]